MSGKEYKGYDDVLEKIAKYPDNFKANAEKIHKTIMEAGGALYPRLWYGMPGYAKTKTGPVIIYFRKDKYITFGKTESAYLEFDDKANSATVAWYFTDINDEALAIIASVVQGAIK